MTSSPPSATEVLSAFGHALDLLIRFSQRPVAGAVLVSGKEPIGMTVQLAPGQTVDIAVMYTDEWHNVLSGVPTTFVIEDVGGVPAPDAATITLDPANLQKATAVINAPVGTTGLRFHAIPIGAPVDLASDDISVQDGPVFTGTVVLTPEA